MVSTWIVKRSAERKGPGDLERNAGPTLSAVIDRYIAESNNAVLGTKAQVLLSRETPIFSFFVTIDREAHFGRLFRSARSEAPGRSDTRRGT